MTTKKTIKPMTPKASSMAVSSPESLDFTAIVRQSFDKDAGKVRFSAAIDTCRSMLGIAKGGLLPKETFQRLKAAEKEFRTGKLLQWHDGCRAGSLKLSKRDKVKHDKVGEVLDVFHVRQSASQHDVSPARAKEIALEEAEAIRKRYNERLAYFSNPQAIPVLADERSEAAKELNRWRVQFKADCLFSGKKLTLKPLPDWAADLLHKEQADAKVAKDKVAKADKAKAKTTKRRAHRKAKQVAKGKDKPTEYSNLGTLAQEEATAALAALNASKDQAPVIPASRLEAGKPLATV